MINDDSRLSIYLRAYKIRRTEQALLDLFAAGKVSGTVHTCIGQELTGVALSQFMHEHDVVFSNHRCHGHYLSRYDDVGGLIGEILGKPSGVCRGYGGSQHLYRDGFFSSGIQGGMTPAALGISFAQEKNRVKHDSAGITVVYIGDGTLGQGIVYEVFNFASKASCPILFVLEDNKYAQTTSQHDNTSGTIRGRAEAFDISYRTASTFALESLLDAAKSSVDFVRANRRPAFLHVETYRLAPHSKGDDFRDPNEIIEMGRKDLLNLFLAQNQDRVEVRSKLLEIDQEIESKISAALQEEDSISVETSLIPSTRVELKKFLKVEKRQKQGGHAKAINDAFHILFQNNPKLMFLGEDIRDPSGGAFKVSMGLSDKFSAQILGTPISEATIIGTGLGLALRGYPSICEIMFADFATLGFDQILNHVAKIPYMYQTEMVAPLLIRTPVGGGRGYGATHSQSMEKYFFGIPNVDVFLLHEFLDVKEFYLKVVGELKHPTIVFENKRLYGLAGTSSIPESYSLSVEPSDYPMHRMSPSSGFVPDITVVCFGGIASRLMEVAGSLFEEEIYLDVFVPTRINDFDVFPIVESCQTTKKLLFLEEGTLRAGLASEVIRRLTVEWTLFGAQYFPSIRTIGAKDLPIPAAPYLEQQVLPSSDLIRASLLEFFYE